jgi:hypothetical protein
MDRIDRIKELKFQILKSEFLILSILSIPVNCLLDAAHPLATARGSVLSGLRDLGNKTAAEGLNSQERRAAG